MVSLIFFGISETAELSLFRRTLSKDQRTEYINAVLCLHEKPSISNKNIPGLRSRYDDFQYLHIEQAFIIHFNVCRLSSIWTQEVIVALIWLT